MGYPTGGRLVVVYSSVGREFELSLPLAPFDPSSFLYSGEGPWPPTESNVGQTFLALASVLAPYYDPSWVFSIKSVWAQTGADVAMLPAVPTVGSVLGSNASAVATDPPLRRGFTFTNALRNTQRVRLFNVSSNEAGTARTVTPGSGGYDARDQQLVAYLAGSATGLRCWDGVPFPPSARAYVRFMGPQAAAATTDGGGAIFTDECLVWPLGGRVCNPSLDHMTIETPGGAFAFDTTGITLPGGHRLEVV